MELHANVERMLLTRQLANLHAFAPSVSTREEQAVSGEQLDVFWVYFEAMTVAFEDVGG